MWRTYLSPYAGKLHGGSKSRYDGNPDMGEEGMRIGTQGPVPTVPQRPLSMRLATGPVP